MKVFTNTFDLAKASPHRFWVAPYSDFKIGIKILAKGEVVDKDFTVKAGAVELTPDEDEIDGFTLYTLKSGDTGFVEYTIEIEDIAEKLKLTQIVTDSTVFEIGGGGGDVPADVATKTWVNSQISDFVEEDALTAYATKDELTAYAETSDLTAYVPLTGNVNMTGSLSVANDSNGVELDSSNGVTVWDIDEGKRKAISLDYDGLFVKDYDDTAAKEIEYPTKSGTLVVDADLTAYYTKSETSSATELADAFANVGGGAISAYALSESPVQSKTQVAQAIDNNTILPQTIAKYNDNSVSAFNVVGAMTTSNVSDSNSTKIIVGSQVTSIGEKCFKNSTTKYVVIPDSVTTIDNKFMGMDKTYGNDSVIEVLDFGNTRTTVPNVSIGRYDQTYFLKAGNNAIAYVPDALYDTWITKSVWSDCASQVKKHSDLVAPSKVSNAPVNYAPPAVKISPVYEYEWETLSASASQHPDTLYVVVPDNGFRPYTQVKYSDNTLSSYDLSGVVNGWRPTNYTEATDIVVGTKVTGFTGSSTCNSCNKLSSLQLPWTVTTIDNETFRVMNALSSLTIPGTVKSIGSFAFTVCSSLNDITFEGRTMAEVQAMNEYDWSWPTGRTIHCIDGDIVL